MFEERQSGPGSGTQPMPTMMKPVRSNNGSTSADHPMDASRRRGQQATVRPKGLSRNRLVLPAATECAEVARQRTTHLRVVTCVQPPSTYSIVCWDSFSLSGTTNDDTDGPNAHFSFVTILAGSVGVDDGNRPRREIWIRRVTTSHTVQCGACRGGVDSGQYSR